MEPTPEQIKNEIAALQKLRRAIDRKKGAFSPEGVLVQIDAHIHVLVNGLTEAQTLDRYQDRHSFGKARNACNWLSGAEPEPLPGAWQPIVGSLAP